MYLYLKLSCLDIVKNYQNIQTVLSRIGEIKLIQCNYSQYSSRYDAYLRQEVLPAFDPEQYGGALYDINVYNVHFVQGVFGNLYLDIMKQILVLMV